MEPVKKECAAADLQRAATVRMIILSDLSRKPTIRQLARKAGTNSSMLKRCFKTLFGITIYKFSLQTRLEHAKKLLSETDYTVQQVAEMTGDTEGSNLGRVFINHFGVTPGSVRQINNQKD